MLKGIQRKIDYDSYVTITRIPCISEFWMAMVTTASKGTNLLSINMFVWIGFSESDFSSIGNCTKVHLQNYQHLFILAWWLMTKHCFQKCHTNSLKLLCEFFYSKKIAFYQFFILKNKNCPWKIIFSMYCQLTFFIQLVLLHKIAKGRTLIILVIFVWHVWNLETLFCVISFGIWLLVWTSEVNVLRDGNFFYSYFYWYTYQTGKTI